MCHPKRLVWAQRPNPTELETGQPTRLNMSSKRGGGTNDSTIEVMASTSPWYLTPGPAITSGTWLEARDALHLAQAPVAPVSSLTFIGDHLIKLLVLHLNRPLAQLYTATLALSKPACPHGRTKESQSCCPSSQPRRGRPNTRPPCHRTYRVLGCYTAMSKRILTPQS